MKYTYLIVELLLVLMLVVSCAVKNESNEKTVPESTAPSVAPAPQLSAEVNEIVQKSSTVTNYKYLFTSRIRSNVGNYRESSYEVYIKDDQAKKVYLSPVKLREGAFYNEVYLDFTDHTAIGICTHEGVSCEEQGKKGLVLSYSEQALVKIPLDLIKNLSPETKKVGKERFDDREADILEYPVTGGKVRISVDTYSGIPLKWDVYDVDGDEEILREEDTFTQLVPGNIKAADLTIPAGYEIVQ